MRCIPVPVIVIIPVTPRTQTAFPLPYSTGTVTHDPAQRLTYSTGNPMILPKDSKLKMPSKETFNHGLGAWGALIFEKNRTLYLRKDLRDKI